MKSAKFKDSSLGPIPQDWEVKRLGDCVALVTKGTTPTSIGCEFTRSGITFIKAESIADNGSLIPSMFAYINEQTHEVLRRSQLKENDILFSIAGVLGRVGMVVKEVLPANTNQALAIIRTSIDGEVDIKFLFYCLQAEYIARAINQLQIGVAQANLSLENVKELWLSLPPLPEQQRIAEALGGVDKLIESLDEQIEKKRLIAKGVAHDLLGMQDGKNEPIRRLPGFKGEWERKTLGELSEIVTGGTPSTEVSAYWGGPIKWMNSGDIHLKRIRDVEGRITKLGYESSSTRMIPSGSVVIALAGQGKTRGTVAITECDLCTNQSIGAILPSKKFSSECLYYTLNEQYEKLRSISSGDGSRGGLSKAIIESFSIVLPPTIAEQQAIAEVLTAADSEITGLEAKKRKYEQIKSGMMRDLLTGKVRMKGE